MSKDQDGEGTSVPQSTGKEQRKGTESKQLRGPGQEASFQVWRQLSIRDKNPGFTVTVLGVQLKSATH